MAPLALGIIMLAFTGFGVFSIGSTQAVAPGLIRTGLRTILVATITVAADKCLGRTAGTLKQSGRSTHQQKG
jgi:hypothetical protein